jgi:hypothetical protein
VKVEVTANLRPGNNEIRGLFSTAGFEFYVYDGAIICMFGLWYLPPLPPMHLALTTSTNPSFQVPLGRWATYGLINNGQGYAAITVDGVPIVEGFKRHTVGSLYNARIGETRYGSDSPPDGLIDDVKIWRIDPHRIDRNFLNRPVDDEARECLRRWSEALKDAMERNPECAEELIRLLAAALDSVIPTAITKSAVTRQLIRQTADEYERLWLENNLGGDMVQLLSDLYRGLARQGIAIHNDPAVRALVNSECFVVILGGLPSLDCDPTFVDFFTNLREAFAGSEIGEHVSGMREVQG